MLTFNSISGFFLLATVVIGHPNNQRRAFDPSFRYDADSDSRSMFPLRSQLPVIPGAPDEAAWFWGEGDELGRLNLLTPRRVLQAMTEIKTGEVIPLNLPLELVDPPLLHRAGFNYSIESVESLPVYDDFYQMNTQTTTQWDGFRHFPVLSTATFYNNCTQPVAGAGSVEGPTCGMQAWAAHGIVGRGILLDYGSYAAAAGLTPKYFENYNITYSDLVAVGLHQGIDIVRDIKIGDVLVVRSGFVAAYSQLTRAEKVALAETEDQGYIGLEQSSEVMGWLHDSYFAGVAGDQPALESYPPTGGFFMHEYLLARWGVTIGELWDLERLAVECKRRNRWTFMLTSSPNNVNGGIGTWANVMAII